MSRRVVLLFLLVIVLLAGAAVAGVATARPALDDDRSAVDARWTTLRGPLTARYDGLAQVATALDSAGAGARTYTTDLADELAVWAALVGEKDADPGEEADAANRLEGLATRARINVARSVRLSRDPALTQAFAGFDAALVPADAVEAYNRAVRTYQSTRTDTLKRLPADLLGYDARPVLVIGVASPG